MLRSVLKFEYFYLRISFFLKALVTFEYIRSLCLLNNDTSLNIDFQEISIFCLCLVVNIAELFIFVDNYPGQLGFTRKFTEGLFESLLSNIVLPYVHIIGVLIRAQCIGIISHLTWRVVNILYLTWLLNHD